MLGIFQGQKEAGTEETEWEMARVREKPMPSRGTSSSDEMAATFPTGVYHQPQTWSFSRGSSVWFYFSFSWQVKNMKYKDKRLKIMNEILSGIKVKKKERLTEKILWVQ